MHLWTHISVCKASVKLRDNDRNLFKEQCSVFKRKTSGSNNFSSTHMTMSTSELIVFVLPVKHPGVDF